MPVACAEEEDEEDDEEEEDEENVGEPAAVGEASPIEGEFGPPAAAAAAPASSFLSAVTGGGSCGWLVSNQREGERASGRREATGRRSAPPVGAAVNEMQKGRHTKLVR